MSQLADALWLLWTSQGFDVPLAVCEGIAGVAGTGRGAYLSSDGWVFRYSIYRSPSRGVPLVVKDQPRPIDLFAYLRIKTWVSAMRREVLREIPRIPPVTAMVHDPATVEWVQRA